MTHPLGFVRRFAARLTIGLAMWVLVPLTACAATAAYDFESDTLNTPPANVTVVSGTAVVVNDATLGTKAIRLNTGTKVRLNNVPLTANSIDFQFRAKLTTGDQLGMMLFADSTLAKGYFLQWDTAGDNRLELYKLSSFVSLQNGSAPLPSTTDYRWRITAAPSGGSTVITVYSWNGSSWQSQLTYTDSFSPHQSGTAGFYKVNVATQAIGDDVSVTYTEATGLAITSPTPYQIFQRSSTGVAVIPISGTYAGSPTAIEARWNSGSWVTIDDSLSGNVFSGTLPNQFQGQGALQARFTNDGTQSGSVAYVGIGDVFVVAGQSNAVGRGTSNQSYSHATLRSGKYTALGWAQLLDPSGDDGGPGGSVWPLIATHYMADQGVPVGFVTGVAWGGSPIVDWQKGQIRYNGRLVPRMSELTGSVKAKAVLWWQGENDASSLSVAPLYEARLNQLAKDIWADYGLPLMVAQIGYYGYAPGTAMNAVRIAQSASWGSGHILAGPSLYDVALVDTELVHFKTNGELQTAANRWWAAIKQAFYGGTQGRGPRFVRARENIARTAITVTFTGSALNLTPATGLQGFQVRNNNVPVTISSAVRASSGSVLLTLSSALTGTATVSFGSGDTAAGLTVPRNSDPFQLPAEIFIARSVGRYYATTATLTTSIPSSIVGQTVVLRGALSPSTASGTLTFKDGSTTIGTATATNGSGSFSFSGLAAGAHSLTVVYEGNDSYEGDTADSVSFTVAANALDDVSEDVDEEEESGGGGGRRGRGSQAASGGSTGTPSSRSDGGSSGGSGRGGGEGLSETFTDVRPGAWYADAVEQAYEEGIFTGYRDAAGNPAGQFGPADPISHAELIKIAVIAGGLLYDEDADASRHWSRPYLDAAKNAGMPAALLGRLDEPATRAEVVQALLLVRKIPLRDTAHPFADLPADHPLAVYVATAYVEGFVTGDTDGADVPTGTFRPDDAINRAEVAQLVVRVLAASPR